MIVPYVDLLRVPFESGGSNPKTGVDCRWVTREVLRRLRGSIAENALPPLPLTAEEAQAWLDREVERNWELVGRRWRDASRCGDVLLTSASGAPHLSVVVVDTNPRLVLTATKNRGVMAAPLRSLVGALSVYRLR